MERDLTVKEGYLAMVIYLENLYKRTNWDDLGAFLGDLLFALDGDPMDPAAWYDWLYAVSKITTKGIISTQKVLTIKEGYLAMISYLRDIQLRWGDDCPYDFSFLNDMQVASDGGIMDSALWYDWLYTITKITTKGIISTQKVLTIKEGYLAMISYLRGIQLRWGDNCPYDFSFLDDMQIALDGSTMDIDSWYNWLATISNIKTKDIIFSGKKLTVQESYQAMIVYLEDLCRRTNSDDLGNVLPGMQSASDGGTIIDSAAWHDWLDVVKKVKTTPLKDLIEEITIKFV